jgi:arsenite methyltransferase
MGIPNAGAHSPGPDCCRPLAGDSESVFERCSWFYAFCREHLFRDHTSAISNALWPNSQPSPETRLLEIACGPGFYACSLAERYPDIQITGVDLSDRLLSRAKDRADLRQLKNCSFVKGNVLALSQSMEPVDAIIASRMLMVVGDRVQALQEIFSALRPGGRCFIAEPTSALRAAVPISCMWLFARLMGDWSTRFQQSGRSAVMNQNEFRSLIGSQPWSTASVWQDNGYQYAVCDRAA